jgi:protein phosphatase
MTSVGREGIVVKPLDFITKGRRGFCSARHQVPWTGIPQDHLRPGVSPAENLTRLRSRAVGAKRSLPRREFALGVEALERFVHKELLRRTHEYVFGVLALESEPSARRL